MTESKQALLSRREFAACSSLIMIRCAAAASGQTADPANGLRVRMVKQFKNGHLLDTSPDGSKICLFFGRAVESFSWRGAWKRDGVDAGKTSLVVIEVGTWRAICSVALRERPIAASFFPDGEVVYAETMAFRTAARYVRQQLLIAVQDCRVEENLRAEKPEEMSTYYSQALADRTLLGTQLKRRERFYALVRARVPTYDELQQEDISPRETFGTPTTVMTSSDRKILAYAVDHSVVCRRSDNLKIVWQRLVDLRLEVSQLAISSDGSRVAISAVNTRFVEQQREYYVAVLNGRDGSLISKVPVNGDVGIDISPDGNFLSVSQRKADARPQRIRPSVQIYEVDSHQLVATVSHDEVSTRDGYIGGLLQSRFTSDGKYLITFGDDDTRVWELG